MKSPQAENKKNKTLTTLFLSCLFYPKVPVPRMITFVARSNSFLFLFETGHGILPHHHAFTRHMPNSTMWKFHPQPRIRLLEKGDKHVTYNIIRRINYRSLKSQSKKKETYRQLPVRLLLWSRRNHLLPLRASSRPRYTMELRRRHRPSFGSWFPSR